MIDNKLKLLGGMLMMGTVLPSCQMPEKEKPTPVIRSRQPVTLRSAPEKEAKKDWTTIEGGLKYQINKDGAADAKVAVDGDAVTVHYTGWLDSGSNVPGQKFDSSHDHGKPFTFTLNAGQVISGWEKGVRGMKVGEQRRLVIPAEFAYGKRGVPGAIPPDATLIFDVELLDIN